MIKLGCCISPGSFVPLSEISNTLTESKENNKKQDILKKEYNMLMKLGYDYMESTIGFINDMLEEEFVNACEYVKKAEFKIYFHKNVIFKKFLLTFRPKYYKI